MGNSVRQIELAKTVEVEATGHDLLPGLTTAMTQGAPQPLMREYALNHIRGPSAIWGKRYIS